MNKNLVEVKKLINSHTLKIYYDGLCPLCSREIDHYRKQSGSEMLLFVDITGQDFNPGKEGLDPLLVHRVMHVKTSDGELKTGVDAFIAIWEILPRYQWMARLAKRSLVHAILQGGYAIFAQVRPFLPRKSRDCKQSPYCEVKGDSDQP